MFLSPHLDDAVLSCGATIHRLTQLGISVSVLTVFAGSPSTDLSLFAQWMHKAWELPIDAPAHRRRENYLAISSLGANCACLAFEDSIYRRHPESHDHIYTSKLQLFSGKWHEEEVILSALTDELDRQLSEQGWALVCAPLGVGGHIDHVLVRVATEAALLAHTTNLLYYEDLPYACEPDVLNCALPGCTRGNLDHLVAPLSEADLQAKAHAIRLYVSQLSQMTRPPGIALEQVIRHALVVKEEGTGPFGERFWACQRSALEQLQRLLSL